MEVPINIDWQTVIFCYYSEKLHAKFVTSKSFYPYIISLPRSSYQIAIWKEPYKLPEENVWCKDIFLNSDCYGIANKLMKITNYNYGNYADESDTPKLITQEVQLRKCDTVKVEQRDYFTRLLSKLRSDKK